MSGDIHDDKRARVLSVCMTVRGAGGPPWSWMVGGMERHFLVPWMSGWAMGEAGAA